MTRRSLIALAAVLSLAPMAAQAVPIPFMMSFDGSSVGPSGAGSFDWDPTTMTMTSLVWDFGAGQTGGLTDALLASSFGSFLFNGVFFGPTPPVTGASGVLLGGFGSILGSFPADLSGASVAFCVGTSNVDCGMPANGPTYQFTDASGAVIAQGSLTVSQALPEPATLALFALGLAGLGFARRKLLS